MTCCLQMHLDDNRIIATLTRDNYQLRGECGGLRETIDKQAAQIRQLQKRLAKAGLETGLEPLTKD